MVNGSLTASTRPNLTRTHLRKSLTKRARGGRYDEVGRLFGRARPACGFSADLKLLLRLGGRTAPSEEAAVFAPWADDEGLRERIKELRRQGRRVISGLPGQVAQAREMGCGEILEQRGGDWVVSALEAMG